MSVGYAELYNCKVSIISAYIKVWSTNINKKTDFPFMGVMKKIEMVIFL